MIRAWHFVGKTLRDGSKIPRDGVWLKHPGEVVICSQGLHASRDAFDALQHAPGATLCLVDCDGKIIEQSDKLVCSARRIVMRMDATDMLRFFARMQAVSCIDQWDAPDVVCDYLMTGDDSIRDAARDAAWDAARAAAAGDAARAASWDAAWAAARAASWAASGAASGAAARAASGAAAGDAARAAAGDAAWAAAGAAAGAAARKDFNELVAECFGVSA